MKNSIVPIVLIACASGGFAKCTMADDVILNGVTFIDQDTTVSEKVTGSGYYVVRNGAKLTLENGENDFIGGIITSNGVVQANAEGALGSGDIVLHKEQTEGFAQVIFNAEGATFANNIIKTAKKYSEAHPNICALKNVTLTGRISEVCENQDYNDWLIFAAGGTDLKPETSPKNYDAVMTMEGVVDVGAGRIATYGWSENTAPRCRISFKGQVVAYMLQTGWSAYHVGNVELWSQDNQIGTLNLNDFQVQLRADNVLRGSVVQAKIANWGSIYGWAVVFMNGYDQTIRCMAETGNSGTGVDAKSYNSQCVAFLSNTARAPTLTVTGSDNRADSATTDMVLIGNVNLVVQKTAGATSVSQGFERRYGTTSGSIVVKDGKLSVQSGARFWNVPSLNVAEGGAVEIKNETSDPFPAVTELAVNGSLSVGSGCEPVFTNEKVKLNIGENGSFKVYKDVVVTVGRLVVNGVGMPAGEYTYENAPWMVGDADYTGTLKVLKGSGLMLLFR